MLLQASLGLSPPRHQLYLVLVGGRLSFHQAKSAQVQSRFRQT